MECFFYKVKYYTAAKCEICAFSVSEIEIYDFSEIKSTYSPSGEFHSPKDYFTRISVFQPPDQVDFTGAMF